MSRRQPQVRTEASVDRGAVHTIHTAAFGGPAEAELVNALRDAGKAVVSLVAERDGVVLGHILFSPVSIGGMPADRTALGLAPVGVLPVHQGQGVGTALIRAGLDICHQRGVDVVVVLGHPDYYPRFGFTPASRFGLSCEYEVPDDHFLAMELTEGVLGDAHGLVRYAPEFAAF